MLRLFPIWNDNNERFISCNESGILQFDQPNTTSYHPSFHSGVQRLFSLNISVFDSSTVCPKVISGRTGTEVIRLQIIPSLQCSKQTRYFCSPPFPVSQSLLFLCGFVYQILLSGECRSRSVMDF